MHSKNKFPEWTGIPGRFIPATSAAPYFGISRAHVYRLIGTPGFPQVYRDERGERGFYVWDVAEWRVNYEAKARFNKLFWALIRQREQELARASWRALMDTPIPPLTGLNVYDPTSPRASARH